MSLDLGTEFDLAARLLLSAVLGALIGLEREIHDHPAGMRTHLLVSLGSASFTVLSIGAFAGPTGDPGRVAAQIVSGIGFLGAGAILKEGATIRGLTTAASLWTVAGVGMAAGVGSWSVAIVVTVIVLLSLWPLRLVARRFVGRERSRVSIRLSAADPHALVRVVEAASGHGASIAHLETQDQPGGGLTIEIEALVRDPAAGARLTSLIGELDGIHLLGSTGIRE
jgi:putative Mg2+ transporter-C (MgtC) family protein